MARIRSVHPELFLDDAFMELSAHARLLWIGIWTQCDDHGVFEWKPNYLKAVIFPCDGVDVPHLLSELEGSNCIRPFEEGGRRYGAVRNFCLFQRPKKPVFRHPFPDWCRTYVALDRRRAEEVANESPTTGGKPPHRREEESRGREEEEPKTTTESVERVAPAVEQPPPAAPTETLSQVSPSAPKRVQQGGLGALMGKPLPADWVPSDELCEEVKADFGMTDADLHSEVPAFHALNAANGTTSQNWNATFRMFCKRWREHRDKQAPPRVEVSRQSPLRPEQFTEEIWDGIVGTYARTGRWSRDAGPDPMHVGDCKAPRHILEKYSVNLDTGERRIPPRKEVTA